MIRTYKNDNKLALLSFNYTLKHLEYDLKC